MGQCSTLPTEGRSANNATRSTESTMSVKGGRDDPRSSHHRHSSSPKPSMGSQSKQRGGGGFLQVQNGQQQPMGMHTEQIQPHQGRNPSSDPNCGDDPMDAETGRDGVPQPPDVAVRTRCYKLNLDSELYPQSSICLGPFSDPPPPLTYSGSTDSSQFTNPTQVAIQTAKIFRGITVSKDGTILSQNARATRSAGRSSKNKKGEKSRQATKIEQAKDLVEESILTGKAPDSGEPANMVSLVIMGEYDDMKYLVRDGSKKLRDARKMPDDALLAINRNRAAVQANNQDSISAQQSPRKRGSPHYSQRVSPLQSNGSSRNLPPQGGPAPPKLKGHPRDRPSSRRSNSEHNRNGSSHHRDFSPMQEDRSGRQPQTPNGGEGGDWSNALSFSRGFQTIWNCGGTGEDSGTISPTAQVNSPKNTGGATPTSQHHHNHHPHHSHHHQQQHNSSHHHHHQQQNPYSAHQRPTYEGRENNNFGQSREGGVTTRG